MTAEEPSDKETGCGWTIAAAATCSSRESARGEEGGYQAADSQGRCCDCTERGPPCGEHSSCHARSRPDGRRILRSLRIQGRHGREVIRAVFEPTSARALGSLGKYEGLDWLNKAVAGYLSPINRDHPLGCPCPSILSAVAAAPAEVKTAFTEALKLRIGAYEAHAPRLPGVTSRERAVAAMAPTIGGLLLARATSGDPLSDDILEACRKWALPERDVPRQ